MTSQLYHKIHGFCILLVAALFAASCAEEEETTAAVGYLHFPSFQVDMTVEDLVETRSVTLPNVPVNAAQVTFVVKDKDGVVKYNQQGAWTSALVMPVGAYTIEAAYGSNTFNKPYFQGSASGTITALGKEKPTLQMSLKNAMMRVSVSADLAEHFEPGGTVFLSANGSSVQADYDKWIYVPTGTDIAVSLSGTNSAGISTSFSYTLSSPVAGKAYNVVCDKDGTNWPVITLPEQQDGAWNTRLYITPATVGNMSADNQDKLVYELSSSASDWSNPVTPEHISGDYYVVKGLTNGVTYYLRARIGKIVSVTKSFTVSEELPTATVTSAHYNDGNGYLAGTNSTVDLGLTGILKSLNDVGLLEVTASLTKSTIPSTVLRTATSNGVMTPATGWPYLLQGNDYKLSIEHKLKDEATTLNSTNYADFSVPAPTFMVSLTSFCSYDEYAGTNGITKNIGDANSRNAETIYGVGATWGISNSLMNNGNYTNKSVAMSLDGADPFVTQAPSVNSCEELDITGLSWAAHTLKASVMFDGVIVEAERTHQITGLPYNAVPPTNSGAHPWTSNYQGGLNTIDFNSGDVTLKAVSRAPQIVSPEFYVPADINVTVNSRAKVDAYKAGLVWVTNNYIASIGGTQVFKQASGKQTGTVYDLSGSGTFTSANKTLTLKSDYTMSGPVTVIYSVGISYR